MPPTLKKPADNEDSTQERAPKFDARQHLERTLAREPGDILKVFPMRQPGAFRVNWYSAKSAQHTAMPGLSITFIRQSQFLYCRLNEENVPEITYPAKQ